jgi:hypothetical protein
MAALLPEIWIGIYYRKHQYKSSDRKSSFIFVCPFY